MSLGGFFAGGADFCIVWLEFVWAQNVMGDYDSSFSGKFFPPKKVRWTVVEALNNYQESRILTRL